jgi:aminoglycoside phosphotransferase (APT) family kinase protein
VERVVGPGSVVRAASPFAQGTSSEVTALEVTDPQGRRQELVLRRFLDATWLALEPDLASREATVLEALAGTPVPAPALLAVDATGTHVGTPAVLTRRLPGEVVMDPADRDRWLHGLADLFDTIHDVPVPPGLRPYRPWYATTRALEPPRWSHARPAWATAIARTRDPAPGGASVFLHRDFQPTNVLWSDGRVSGVVDWVEASAGPAGADLGHCRCNLAQDLGRDAADALRALVGAVDDDPYWDLVSAVDFLPALDPSPPPAAVQRIDAFVTGAVARL